MKKAILGKGFGKTAALTQAQHWDALHAVYERMYRLRYLFTPWRRPLPVAPQPGARWLVTDADGGFVSIVSADMAEALTGELSSPDLTLTRLPLDHPFPGSVPYPLTAETAALLIGPRQA